jgi:hypothetical protein
VLKPDSYHVRAGQTEMIIHPAIETKGLAVEDVDALSQKVREVLAARFVPEEE